jgi:CubicO group peptidase (beta-lactamase class C family)
MRDIQKKIQKMLDKAVALGHERGMAVTAYFEGQQVVDAWAGVADVKAQTPVNGDTLFPVFSVTKGITATMYHILAEQGRIDHEKRVADYWPEFGCHGKEKITMRLVLNHTAGLHNMPADLTPAECCDWKIASGKIAAGAPVFEPGSKFDYEAISYSWLVGEPLCRVTGKTFAQILQDEIVRPLKIKDIYAGIPKDVVGDRKSVV